MRRQHGQELQKTRQPRCRRTQTAATVGRSRQPAVGRSRQPAVGRSRQPAAHPAWGRTARRAVQRSASRASSYRDHRAPGDLRAPRSRVPSAGRRAAPRACEVERRWKRDESATTLAGGLQPFGWTPRAAKIRSEHARRRCAIAGRRPRAGAGGNVTAAAGTWTPRGAPALLPGDRDERNSARQHEASEDPRRRRRPCACERNARCDRRRVQAARGAACTDARKRTRTCRRRGHCGAQARERRAGMS